MADPIDPTGGSGAPDEQSLKILREVNETLRQSAEYSKQLAEAINSMAKPMQQMNDMHKAIKDQMSEQAKQAKEVNEAQQKSAQSIKDELTTLTSVASALREIIVSRKEVAGAEKEIIELEKESARLKLEATKAYSDTSKETREKAKETIEHNRALEKQLGLFSQLGKEVSKINDSVSNMKGIGQIYGRTTGTLAEISTGHSTMAQSVQAIGSRISSLVPTAGGVGGLLGLMIYGKMKEAEFHALGETAIQQFDQVGGKMSAAMEGRITNLGRQMTVSSMIAKGDLMAVANAFAQTGVSAQEAGVPIEGFSKKLGGDLMFASLAADKALEMPAGTMAKMAGMMSTHFNTSAKEAFNQLMNIGEAAKSAGMNAALFMQQVLEASSALRLLNANGESVGQMQLNFTRQMIAAGHDKRFAAAYAAEGTKSAIQSIANLQVGMSAVVGERMDMGTGLDAWYAMKSGHQDARGGKQLDPGAVASELAKMAHENGRTRAEQVYFLTQLTGSTVGGAETILDAGQEYDKTGSLSKQAVAGLNKAFQTEAEKTSSIERHLAELKDAFAHVGVGLLSAVVNTLRMIYHSIMAGIAWVQEGKGSDSYKAHMYAISQDQVSIGKSFDQVGKGLSMAGDAGGRLLKDFGLGGKWGLNSEDVDRMARKYDDEEYMRSMGGLDDTVERTDMKITKKLYVDRPTNRRGKKQKVEVKVTEEDDNKVHQ